MRSRRSLTALESPTSSLSPLFPLRRDHDRPPPLQGTQPAMLSNALRTGARPLAAGALRSSLARQAAPAARLVHATRAAREDAPKAANPGELLFTLTDPASCIFEAAPVEMVILPGVDGQFGVMPNHVPTIAELKPGVVSVQEAAGGPLTKYFVSGGFASIGEDSKLAVSTLMAAPLEELDADAIKTGLAQYQAAYEKATDDMVKSEAEIGVEVYQAMSYAISEA